MIHTGCAGDESFQLFNLNAMELICQSYILYESGISTGCWRMGLMRVTGWANGYSDIVWPHFDTYRDGKVYNISASNPFTFRVN